MWLWVAGYEKASPPVSAQAGKGTITGNRSHRERRFFPDRCIIPFVKEMRFSPAPLALSPTKTFNFVQVLIFAYINGIVKKFFEKKRVRGRKIFLSRKIFLPRGLYFYAQSSFRVKGRVGEGERGIFFQEKLRSPSQGLSIQFLTSQTPERSRKRRRSRRRRR